MKNYSIKKEVITYVTDHVINFFESGQLLAITSRNFGVSKLYLFRISVDKLFNEEIIRVSIRYQYFTTNGEVSNGNFDFWLEDLINNKVDYKGDNDGVKRNIITTIQEFLSDESNALRDYFIINYSMINKLINECKESIESYTNNMAFDEIMPLKYELVRPFLSDDKANEWQFSSPEYSWKRDGKLFKNDDELLLYMFPNLPNYTYVSVQIIMDKLYELKQYKYLIELDYLRNLISGGEYKLTVKDRVSLLQLEYLISEINAK